MTEAVLEPAQDTIVDALFRLACEKFAERPVHGASRLRIAGKQKRQIDETKLRYPIGQIARRLITQRDLAALNQGENVLRLVAVVHDVEDVVDSHILAELRLEFVADQF